LGWFLIRKNIFLIAINLAGYNGLERKSFPGNCRCATRDDDQGEMDIHGQKEKTFACGLLETWRGYRGNAAMIIIFKDGLTMMTVLTDMEWVASAGCYARCVAWVPPPMMTYYSSR
jgi:hypothetical protein